MPHPEPARFDPSRPYEPRSREPFNPDRHRASLETCVVVTACLVWLISTVASAILMIRDPTVIAMTVMLIDTVITPVVVVVRRVVRR